MLDKMADISLIQDVFMDANDEGVYEQGDCISGSPTDDDLLPPLSRIQKYAQSANVYDRQMVARIVQELFRTAPPESLTADLASIMNIVKNLGERDETMVRADLLEQIPHMASQAIENCNRIECLKNVIGEYLLPLVVRNLGSSDNSVDKAAHSTLIHLMEQGLITRLQAEIQVCPAILALSNEEQSAEINTGAITLMSKIAPHLGRDITERVFLSRFSELCSTCMFYIRKVCAAHIGHFCAVVGKERFEKVLLPCYLSLCRDNIWGVRQSCAEVIMFVSSVCPADLRRTQLAPAFAKLLQDECRWVQISAFQHLGPFIATFSEPPITSIAYNNRGELVFVNNDGNEFLVDSSSVREVRFYKFLPNQQPPPTSTTSSMIISNVADQEIDFVSLFNNDKIDEKLENNIENEVVISNDCNEVIDTTLNGDSGSKQTDEDIKEIVESVKNAVLNYRPIEQQETGVIGGDVLRNNLNNGNNVIDSSNDNIKNEQCDKNLNNIVLNTTTEVTTTETLSDNNGNANDNKITINNDTNNVNNQVINSESDMEDDNLRLYNSYNYWYISPEMPLDLSIIEEGHTSSKCNKLDDTTVELENLYADMNLNNTTTVISYNNDDDDDDDEEERPTSPPLEQNIVPEILIKHFLLMADTKFSSSIDNEMPYHCAYSLPAVALTLKEKNWPLLKDTIERLSCDMQYKVRRTVASCLHELAELFGKDIATEHLTPIFDGFIKDLDEVRIGILKHLARFLRLIDDEKRLTYLPRLQDFLKTENESNWRFRYELAVQVRLIITCFNPVDVAKHVILIAEALLHDVSAVREAAIDLITELLRHITSKPGLNTLYLVRLVEKFAHSKKWKRRQTFALLCWKLLECEALPPEQFATDIMPHLLDLSWDPVANVRLVVAKTIAQHIIPNKYFADPNNQHLDSLGTVIRRLQDDKDRDVRQFAELGNSVASPTSYIYCT